MNALSDELTLIGAMLRAPHMYRKATAIVNEADFGSAIARTLFKTIGKCREAFGGEYDAAMVQSAIDAAGMANEGQPAINQAWDLCVNPENADKYAWIVKKNAVRRMVEVECGKIMGMASDGDDPNEIIAAVRALSVNASRGVSRQDSTKPIGEYVLTVLDRIEANRGKGKVMGLETGLLDLDSKTTGFHPGELIIVAARPGMGKTTLALNVLRNMAGNGHPALMFSLEMTGENLASNMMAAKAKVNGQYIRQMDLSHNDLKQFISACEDVQNWPGFVCDQSAMRIEAMQATAYEYHEKHGIKAVIVDYLQLARADAKGRSREQEVGEISRGLKAMAKDLGIPVIALAQLNRQAESRQGGRPLLSDLRESGSIEQDADCVLLLHRPEYYDKTAQPGKMIIDIAKQRNGPTGEVEVSYQGQYYRVENLASPSKGGYQPQSEEDF